MTNDNELVYLGVVAFECGMGVRDLERRCNGGVELDADGARCISRRLFRELIAERDQRLEAQRAKRRADHEAAQAQKQARQRERERLDRLHEKQAALMGEGMTAIDVMKLASGEFERAPLPTVQPPTTWPAAQHIGPRKIGEHSAVRDLQPSDDRSVTSNVTIPRVAGAVNTMSATWGSWLHPASCPSTRRRAATRLSSTAAG